MTTLAFITGLLDWLLADPSHLVVAAGAIAAVTPTPSPNTTFGKVYKVLEILALNVLHAKETGEPVAAASAAPMPPSAIVAGPTLTGGAGSIVNSLLIAAMIGLVGLGLSACASSVQTDTIGQKVYAIGSDFHAAQEGALTIVTSPVVPAEVKQGVKVAEQTAHDALAAAEAQVQACAKTQTAGTTCDDVRLNAAVAAGSDAVGAFVTYVQSHEVN